MTVLESLRKNAAQLGLGFGSLVVVLLLMRQSSGEPLFQPQADLGVLIGAVLVTGFMVMQDIKPKGNK